MKPVLALLAAVLLSTSAAAVHAQTAPMKLSLAYDGRLFIKVLDIHIVETVGSSGFTTTAALKTYGVLDLFKPFDVEAQTQGRIEGGEAKPSMFGYTNHDVKHHGMRTRVLKVVWTDNDVVMTAAPPIGSLGEPPASREQKLAAADPLTQYVRVTLSHRPTAGCGVTNHFFDGKQRYDLVLGPAQPTTLDDGQRAIGLINPVRCTVRYEEVAGFKRKPPGQRTQGLNSPIVAVMAQKGAGGPWLFASLTADTVLGKAQILLRQATLTGVQS